MRNKKMCSNCGETDLYYEYEKRFWCLNCDKEVQE